MGKNDLCRHWTPSNRDGFCLADICREVKGDLGHMLFECPALRNHRARLFSFWLVKTEYLPDLHQVMQQIICSPTEIKMSFVPLFEGVKFNSLKRRDTSAGLVKTEGLRQFDKMCVFFCK